MTYLSYPSHKIFSSPSPPRSSLALVGFPWLRQKCAPRARCKLLGADKSCMPAWWRVRLLFCIFTKPWWLWSPATQFIWLNAHLCRKKQPTKNIWSIIYSWHKEVFEEVGYLASFIMVPRLINFFFLLKSGSPLQNKHKPFSWGTGRILLFVHSLYKKSLCIYTLPIPHYCGAWSV